MLGYTRLKNAVRLTVIGGFIVGLSGLVFGCGADYSPRNREFRTLDSIVSTEDGGLSYKDSSQDGGLAFDGSFRDQGVYSDVSEETDSSDLGFVVYEDLSVDSGSRDVGESDTGSQLPPIARLNCPDNLGPNQDERETICMANANEDVSFSACDSFDPDGSIVRYQVRNADIRQGGIDYLGIIASDGWISINDCNFTRTFNSGESAICLRTIDNDGLYSEPDCNRVVVNEEPIQELKAIACPDVAEVAGGPYRINDVNDAHNGWCLYEVRPHERFRFDGCRSTGSIDEYLFDYGGSSINHNEQCWDDSRSWTENVVGREYQGSLRVFKDNPDGSYDYSSDSVLFRIIN